MPESLYKPLADGGRIPIPAYGVGTAWYKRDDSTELNREMIEAVKKAIEAGFTHFDNAEVYQNEREFGEALKESGVERKRLFITTKVLGGIDDIEKALKSSLDKLGIDYVDLYLIHSHTFADKPGKPSLKEAWRAMERVKELGLARHIGVSNYRPSDLLETLKGCTYPPQVNQIELHPHCYAESQGIIETCKAHNIALESYGPQVPLREGIAPELERELEAIASEITQAGVRRVSGEDGHGDVTPGQILLRWNYQIGSVPISTSSKTWRMKEILRLGDFSLTPEQMERINVAGTKKHLRKFASMIGPL